MSEDIETRLAELESIVERQRETIAELQQERTGDDAPDGDPREPSSDTHGDRGRPDNAEGADVPGSGPGRGASPGRVDRTGPTAGVGIPTARGATGPTVRAGRIQNAVGDAQLQAAFDGLVVPVGPGLGMDDAVDPSTTETPVQDAIDAIDATAWYHPDWSPGAVLLPTGRIEESGALTNTLGKSFLGWGVHATEIRFPDLGTPAIEQAAVPDPHGDGMGTYWDGIRFHGVDGANRTGSAIHVAEDDVRGFNVGRVTFQEWNDVVHLDGATWSASHWDWFATRDVYGRSIVVDDAPVGGSGWTVDVLDCSRDNGAGRVVDARDSDGGTVTIRNFHVRVTAETTDGGAGPPAIDVDAPETGRFRIDDLHYETTVGLDLPAVVRFAGATNYRLGAVDLVGPEDTRGESLRLDDAVRLDAVGTVEIGQHTRDAAATTVDGAVLAVGGAPRPGTVRFHGRSDEVAETYGSTAGKIVALEDRRVVDCLYRATVTHTTGGPTVVDGLDRERVGGRPDAERTATPEVQRLDPVGMPNTDFSVEPRFEWRGTTDDQRWVLVLEWGLDPGVDVEFDLEVTTRGTR